jgi:hypothetical protein
MLPFMKYSTSRWLIGWLIKSGQLENTSFMMSNKSCSSGPESTRYRVAGFRVLTTSGWTCRFTQNMFWYLTIQVFVSQSLSFYSIRVKTEWGIQTVSFCPKISLSVSAICQFRKLYQFALLKRPPVVPGT